MNWLDKLRAIDLNDDQEWYGDIAVDPETLKERERTYFYGRTCWTVVKIIDFICEGENCDIRHRGLVMKHNNNQFQLWDFEDKSFWINVVRQKDRKEYRKRSERRRELEKNGNSNPKGS